MSKKKRNRSGKAAVEARKRRIQGDTVRYKCMECGIEEDIPRSAIEIIDIFDEGMGMPEFSCKVCKGTMEAIEDKEVETIHIVSTGNSIDDEGDDLWF
ncbi:MAG: hypothetical protein N2509_07965 [Treponemataceae bacterium]|nr:hypothetical protein [Treponemataceae bacterium]